MPPRVVSDNVAPPIYELDERVTRRTKVVPAGQVRIFNRFELTWQVCGAPPESRIGRQGPAHDVSTGEKNWTLDLLLKVALKVQALWANKKVIPIHT